MSTQRQGLLFVVSEDWYFVSHRLPLALAAKDAGLDVALAANVADAEMQRKLEGLGIRVFPWKLKRGSKNIIEEIVAMYRLHCIFRSVRPHIVHQVAIKPVLYGTLLARLHRIPKIVNALGGLGFLFSQGSVSLTRTLLRPIVIWSFKRLLSGNSSVLILQNPDDKELLVKVAQVKESQTRLIRGAGVSTVDFNVSEEPSGTPIVILPARMLYDKGIGEFVDAARILIGEGINARFQLVGGFDECNPAAIPPGEIDGWVKEGIVEWLGKRTDMPDVLRRSNLVCLPSYREGLPKCLLEAAASGRAIVATDVPGCREIVVHGRNGLLVPPRDARALAAALRLLILDPGLRQQMGMHGRRMVVKDFSEAMVVQQTLELYRSTSDSTSTSPVLDGAIAPNRQY